jgi:hypothetical protein
MRYEAPELNVQASAKLLILGVQSGSHKPGSSCFDGTVGNKHKSSAGAYELDE